MPSEDGKDAGAEATGTDAYRLMYVGPSSFQIEERIGARLERLGEEGFEVHVLAGADGGFGALAERGIEGRPIPVGEGAAEVPALVGAFFIVQAYFIEKNPVLVHAEGGALAWLGAYAAHRVGTPAVFATRHAHRLEDEPVTLGDTRARLWAPGLVERLEERLGESLEMPLRRGSLAMARHLGHNVDGYLVSNERDYAYLGDREIVPPGKLEMIIGGDGVDLERFNPEADEFPSVAEARGLLEVPDDWDRVLGYRGALRADRGSTDLLAALDAVLEQHPGVGWLVSLEAPVDEGMMRRLERRAESGRVRVIAGNAGDEAPVFYRCLDLLVWPNWASSEAREPMEAAAMKVPTVAWRRPTTESVVSDGHTGRLVEAGQRESFLKTVVGLAGDPKRLRDFGVRARSRAGERFDRRDVDEQILKLYDLVLSAKLDG